MPNEIKIQNGLRELPKDGRDFSFVKVFGALPMETLPKEFMLDLPKVENQYPTYYDFCTAFATTSLSELQEGIELSPFYQFAKTKQLMGDWRNWGADLRSAAKAAVKFGSLKESDVPDFLKDKDRDYVANWENWPKTLDERAKEHCKESFFSVDGYDSSFDAVKNALWQNRAKKRGVLCGAEWRPEWIEAEKGVVPEEYSERGSPDANIILGWKIINGKEYIVVQLSAGKEAGDGGRFYISKGVFNKEYGKFGLFMFVDMLPKEARKLSWSWLQRLVYFIINLFK